MAKTHPFGRSARYEMGDDKLSQARRYDMTMLPQTRFGGLRRLFEPGQTYAQSFFTGSVIEEKNNERDIELLRRIAARDRAAFAEFYDRHSALLFSIAFRILNNASEAEDVLQETFVQIWEKAGSFDPKLGKTTSWAVVLVRNKAIDRLRAARRRSRLAEEAGVESAMAGETSEPANAAIYGREKAKLIQSAMGGLPAEQRQAIELAYFSGLTQFEVAEKLREPLGTIKARIRRGLLKLRDQLEGVL